MADDNVTEIKNQNGGKPKTPEQIIKEVQGKIENRRGTEFTKVVEVLMEKKSAAEKTLALIDKEIEEAIAKYKAGL